MNIRQWVCVACGVIHDRDTNAAINILKQATVGERGVKVTSGYTYVRVEGYLFPRAIALRADNGQYVGAEGGGHEIVANRTWIGDWEQFTWVRVGGSRVALRVHNGQLVCAEGGGGHEVVANRTRVDRWETFEIIAV